MFFIASAQAAAAAAASSASSGQSSLLSLLPIVVLILVFYFFIIRPQQKRAREENQMRNSLRIGDKIVTTSGIFGSVVQIDDKKNVVSIEISKGVNIIIYKSSIGEILKAKEDEKPKLPKN